MSNPTPGPWWWRPGNTPGMAQVLAADDTPVAYVLANDAPLIAAAPDTRDALEALWGFVQDLAKSNPGFMGKMSLQDYALMNKAYLLTPAALAKAKG